MVQLSDPYMTTVKTTALTVFPIQELNPGLPHCRLILYQLSQQAPHHQVSNIQLYFFPHFSLCCPPICTFIYTICCYCCWVASFMSDSVRPHRRQPTRLPHPWDSPGKNTRVGCHFLLQCMKVKSESEITQLCLTLRDPMDYSLPGSSIHRIFQARVLKWVAIAFSTPYAALY